MRRSFFLAFFIVMVFMCDCPCDLKRYEDRSAQQGEQNCNIGECHGPHPLSALKHPGSGQLFKSQCLTRCFGAGKESAACVSNTVPFFLPLLALTLEYHKFRQFAIAAAAAKGPKASWKTAPTTSCCGTPGSRGRRRRFELTNRLQTPFFPSFF